MYRNIYNFTDFMVAVEKEGQQRLALSVTKDYASDLNYRGIFNSYSKMKDTIESQRVFLDAVQDCVWDIAMDLGIEYDEIQMDKQQA
jgi:hypothetical protein